MKRCHSLVAGLFVLICNSASAATYQYSTINFPGSGLTVASGINNAGQIVGTAADKVFLDSSGVFTTIPVNGFTVTAAGINDAGQIVVSTTSSSFLFENGAVSPILTPGFVATGINNSSQVVGYSSNGGFVEQNGNVTAINVPGPFSTYPQAISNTGEIVGYYVTPSQNVLGFTYDNGVFNTEVTGTSMFTGVNSSGQIIGFDQLGNFVTFNGVVTRFNDVPGSIYTSVRGINDAGQIVGFFDAPDTENFGFLATPIPEPGSNWLLAFGMGSLVLLLNQYRKKPGI